MTDPTDVHKTYTNCTTDFEDYIIGVPNATGTGWESMVSNKKVSSLKDELPDGVADMLVWIAGKDFTVGFSDKDLTKKGKFKKIYVQALFTRAFEERFRMMGKSFGDVEEQLEVLSNRIFNLGEQLSVALNQDIGYDNLRVDLDRVTASLNNLKVEVKGLTREVPEPSKALENKIMKKVEAAIEKMEERYYTVTGRRKLMT